MGAKNLMRRVLDSALPSGPLWKIAEGDDLDKFYHGLAQNYEDARVIAAAIAKLRDPSDTSALADLEMEFGVTPDTNFTTAQRRAYLESIMGERCVLPSWVNLQAKLQNAGFGVYVYPNDPPLDPATIIAAHPEGYYLVNGEVLDYQERDYVSTVCDTASDSGETTVCADTGSELIADRGDTVGAFEGMLRVPYVYKSPTRYRWPKVFIVAASQTICGPFADWGMEYATTSEWRDYNGAYLSKSLAWKQAGAVYKKPGIRSLEVMATAGWTGSIGPYAEQTITMVKGSWTVTVYASASSTVKAGLVVCDKDGVWDTAGIVTSATGSTGELLTYSAANGVSGARLYVTTGTAAPVVGNYARFDNLAVAPIDYVSASISSQWRARFEKLILRYKPAGTWALVLVNWTVPAPVPGPTEEDD